MKERRQSAGQEHGDEKAGVAGSQGWERRK